MSANTEKCAAKDKSECGYNEFRRLKYFHGMLLDEKDFQAEQQYHASKRRFLNRMLHGSGVVCGLELRGEKGKRWIEVTSGLALDCSGNEIWVQKDLRIDLSSLLPPKQKGKGKGDCRPEDEDDGLLTYYIGIRYEEKPTSPVSVYLPSGSCEERTCENSRWKEGFCVEIVECCTEKKSGLIYALCQCEGSAYPKDSKFKDLCGKCGKNPNESDDQKGYVQADPKAVADWCRCMTLEEFCESSVPCSECCSCEEPCYVILGQIKIDKNNCVLESLCMNECRRYVLTGRFVQQLLLRVLGGGAGFFDMKVGQNKVELPENLEEYIYNPIKALCWWLPYKLQGGKFEYLGCDKERGEEPTDPGVILAAVERVAAQQQVVMQQIETVRTEQRAIVGRIEKLERPPIDVQPTAAKTPKPPKE